MDQQFETKARETMRLVAFMMAIDESFENIKAAIEIAEKELGLTTYDQHQTFLMTMAGLQ
jgi:hypothetical protein